MIASDRAARTMAEPDTPARPATDEAPLYRRVSTELRLAIEDGTHPVGSLLPTEAELSAQFNVSRHTVREAIRMLADLGLVTRRQGQGTRVAAVSPPANYVQTMRSLEELTQYALNTHFDIAEVGYTNLSEAEAEIVSTPPGSRWLRIVGTRWDGPRQTAICSTTVFTHMRFATLLQDVREAAGPIYDLIERRSGERIHEAIQEITAEPAPRKVSTALGIRQGSSMMRFVRRYLDASGAPMLVSINWHPAERFVYRMRLKRDHMPLG
jgi:DNA-binding GntR family transcriptional regulator